MTAASAEAPRITPRLGYAIALLVCLGLLAFALYLQYVEHQEPCPLCILQRIAFFAMMVVLFVGAVHGPARRGAMVYSAIVVIVALVGAAIAGRHVWLQHLPASMVPACGPGLGYMLERFPLSQALQKVLAGSGECAEVGWTFLGLSIAGWSLVWFVILGAFAIYIAMRARPAPQSRFR
jgi:disulfide bond formation protein DsbB